MKGLFRGAAVLDAILTEERVGRVLLLSIGHWTNEWLTSSVIVKTPTNMFDGEQEGNGFLSEGDPPRRILIGKSSSIHACEGSGEGKEGKGYCDGFPEDVVFGRNEKNALAERIVELEKELYDYQYHMGLLLIEKKMRTCEVEVLREELSKAITFLKSERAAFSFSSSEKSKQVESILIALETEKQHVANLEKTIRKMQVEEKYPIDKRETLQSCEPSLQENELELKRSESFLGGRKVNITNEKEEWSEVQEEFEEIRNSFVRMNNASNYREAGIRDRQQNLASKEKEAERKQERLEKKERDLIATKVKLPTRESDLLSDKQISDQELGCEGQSIHGESKEKLNKLRKQNAVEGKYGSLMINDLLAYKKEVETEKVRVQKDKETLNTLYNRLQNFKQELVKKRDIFLSLPEHCKACMNCNIIFSEIDLASLETFEGVELADDIVLLSIPNEYVEKKRMKRQNNDSSPQSKGYQSVKIGGCLPCFQQCPELCNFNSIGKGLYPTADGNGKKASDAKIRSQPIPVISHDNQHNKRVDPGNGAKKIEIIDRFPNAVHSSGQYSEIANDALEIECQLNASSINQQNGSHALSSKYNKGGASSNKRKGSLVVVVENSEETLDDIPREIKHLHKCGSEDLKDAYEESKLNLVNADKMRGSAEQWDHLCHAEIDSYDRIAQPALEGHRKRQRTSDIRFSFPGQKRYHFRPSTVLKVLISKLQSEHVVLGRDNDETDIDYEPSKSD